MTDLRFTHVGSPNREPIQYRGCGLDNIYLTSGYHVRMVAGEEFVSVHDADGLHQAIAMTLAQHRKVLSGKEVRFLRKFLDLTQRELGDLLGVSDQSVARYEKDQSALDGATDALLRILVVQRAEDGVNVRQLLECIRSSDDLSEDCLTLEHDDHEWRTAA